MIIRVRSYELLHDGDNLRAAKNELDYYLRKNPHAPRSGAFMTKHGIYFLDYKRSDAVLAKTRLGVVISMSTQSITYLPCYTKSGRGIGHLHETTQLEYVGLRDDRKYPYGREWHPQGRHRALMTTNMKSADIIKPETCVALASPVSIKLDHKLAIVGDIRAESLRRLNRLYLEHGMHFAQFDQNAEVDDDDDQTPVDEAQLGVGYYYAAMNVRAQMDPKLAAKKKRTPHDDLRDILVSHGFEHDG
ncbi:uncharacterized protein AB675_8273 [Cyphellophora attinorum]|uniref:Uncharacterized protein n=1 Tax=Cyphellophora attinorum TaxID=1664694 RepID=A0A0N0NQR3_9EURO|nr:uncharacterized protein AB675_8273 [Phialophora attinorum]KPI44208.1 hypothetical protein AB675_8273 [Phialophora attinorum]